MATPPNALYSAVQTRQLDHLAISDCGIPGYELMCRAGQAAFDLIRLRWPTARNYVALCGAGNNAGDGYVIARLLANVNLSVTVISMIRPEKLQGDAQAAYQAYEAAGGSSLQVDDCNWQRVIDQADILIDALLGTGLSRPIATHWASVINYINQADKAVLSVDIPSGLNADTGHQQDIAIVADATLTFIAYKKGLFTADGPDCCGALFLSRLGIPDAVYSELKPEARLVSAHTFPKKLFNRVQASHKGSFGHILIAGGNIGMSGAANLAAEAALRSGSGLVSKLTRSSQSTADVTRMLEIMSCTVGDLETNNPFMRKLAIIGLGPGLGRDAWAKRVFQIIIQSQKSLVLDADALNLLADAPFYHSNWILTPHPQEAARLLACSTEEVQRDRFAAGQKIVQKYGGVCVLKGNGTLIQDTHQCYLVNAGNPGMATAGSGDVLTGIISSLWAQCQNALIAAAYGAWLHACAGDLAAQSGQNGIVASDISNQLKTLLP
ncbi:MAG: NAD(P)H-hydrate dehydratase [Gammaproteobacteria bacterium]|nr:NAD(P)H-hydrate dehydratase [Gammaproteobacteria bacterium]